MRRHGSVLTPLLIAFSVFAILIAAATVVNYVAVGRQNAVAQQVTGRYTVLQQEESRSKRAMERRNSRSCSTTSQGGGATSCRSARRGQALTAI